jgi:hypothetical protein
MSGFSGSIAAGVAEVDAQAWDACFPGEAEGYAYYAVCDAAAAAAGIGVRTAAACVADETGIVAVVPFFRLDYRLDTPLQGRLRAIAEQIARRLPGLAVLKVLCIGSPYAERCHLGFTPRLSPQQRQAAFGVLQQVLAERALIEGAHLVAWKDLCPADAQAFGGSLAGDGFARLGSLPVAVLDLPFADEAAYLATLSSATRKDIRRKLAKAGAVRIEMRRSIAGIEAEIAALYESTRAESGLDYGDLEVLPPGYFAGVSQALGDRAVFALYWVGETLAAFNLLLVEPDRVVDKFLGMRYPLARDHNLYAVSWMANVRFCLANGIARLQSGQTAYASKLRFGSRLEPSTIFFRHRRPVFNWALRRLSPLIAFDRLDPDLRAHRAASLHRSAA